MLYKKKTRTAFPSLLFVTHLNALQLSKSNKVSTLQLSHLTKNNPPFYLLIKRMQILYNKV